ncbi:hypothetical protein LIA77_03367 [Sarocladium implicatum]|nr:hypothetical protein LIA77_03367 [Sarocladium implicatum]
MRWAVSTAWRLFKVQATRRVLTVHCEASVPKTPADAMLPRYNLGRGEKTMPLWYDSLFRGTGTCHRLGSGGHRLNIMALADWRGGRGTADATRSPLARRAVSQERSRFNAKQPGYDKWPGYCMHDEFTMVSQAPDKTAPQDQISL